MVLSDVGWWWENEAVESRQPNARTASERADKDDEKEQWKEKGGMVMEVTRKVEGGRCTRCE